ncbi:MAG: SLOG family protein [Christensenellales bacterium]
MKLSCCFTGHRSQKLPWGFNENDERCKVMIKKVENEICKAIERGYSTFLSGMALGFDMICAEIVLRLKNIYPYINLVCVLPCKSQDAFWSNYQKRRYASILEKADKVVCMSENYTNSCIRERNEYMVNNATLMIALFSGRSGGTKKTIDYAKSKGLELVVIEP